MAATLLGTVGVWGIATDQTGILLTDTSFDFSNQETPVLSIVGEPIGFAFNKEKVEVKLSGLVPATSPFSAKLATALTLANAIPAHLQATGGTTIIKTISRTSNNEDWEKIEVGATHHPFVTVGA